MPIRFKQILQQVIRYAPTQLTNANFARIKEFKGIRKDEDNRYYAYAITYSTRTYNRKTRTWQIKYNRTYYDTFIMVRHYKTRKSTIVLSCSCPDFKYRHEVALYKRGGAEVEYSNGKLPKIRNPKMRRTCCKHCLRFYQFLSNEYPSIFEPQPQLEANIGK